MYVLKFLKNIDDDVRTHHNRSCVAVVVYADIIILWYNKDEHGTSSAFSQPTTPPENIVYIEFSKSCLQ